MSKKISVKSHVSRDFLQNAVYFNTLPKVVWEYVSNSLDNGKDDVPTTVVVEIRKEEDALIIADNGSGMSRNDLERFFTMHGENIQRKKRETCTWKIRHRQISRFWYCQVITH
jgi:HSP90 family molecular chaperone